MGDLRRLQGEPEATNVTGDDGDDGDDEERYRAQHSAMLRELSRAHPQPIESGG